jgi:hypothetical protein
LNVSEDFRSRLLESVGEKRILREIRPLLLEQLELDVSRSELHRELLAVMSYLRSQEMKEEEDRVADVADLMTNSVIPELRV